MFAIAYFVATTTCLNGASSIKSILSPGQNCNDSIQNDASMSNSNLPTSKGVTKPNGILTTKKPATKKSTAPLLKTEKKEL